MHPLCLESTTEVSRGSACYSVLGTPCACCYHRISKYYRVDSPNVALSKQKLCIKLYVEGGPNVAHPGPNVAHFYYLQIALISLV